jgi:hypothetical protein
LSKSGQRRTEIVAALEGMLAQVGLVGLVGLARQNGYRRYLKVRDGGQAEVDWRRVKRDERYNGKFLLRSNTELSAAEIGLAYKELWRVKHAFRELKTGLEMRTVRHWAPSRVRGHFGVCFLALVVESTLARMLKEKNLQVSYRKVLKDMEQVKAVRVELDDRAFLPRTRLPGRAYDAFQSVGLHPSFNPSLLHPD